MSTADDGYLGEITKSSKEFLKALKKDRSNWDVWVRNPDTNHSDIVVYRKADPQAIIQTSQTAVCFHWDKVDKVVKFGVGVVDHPHEEICYFSKKALPNEKEVLSYVQREQAKKELIVRRLGESLPVLEEELLAAVKVRSNSSRVQHVVLAFTHDTGLEDEHIPVVSLGRDHAETKEKVKLVVGEGHSKVAPKLAKELIGLHQELCAGNSYFTVRYYRR